jgi:cyanophycinase-like exopeptidase
MKTKRSPTFLKKPQRKDPLEIRSVRTSTEEAVTQLAETIFEFGAAASRNQITDAAQPPTHYLKTLVSIATNAWRAKTKMVDAATGEIREDMKRVGRHIEAIYRNLAEAGIVIRDHTGDAYDEGQPMRVVASKPTQTLDKKRVSETLLPSIFWNNRLIQNGEVEIATPLTPNSPAEPQLL